MARAGKLSKRTLARNGTPTPERGARAQGGAGEAEALGDAVVELLPLRLMGEAVLEEEGEKGAL